MVRADVRDRKSVQAAVQGHDAVVSAIRPPGRRSLGLYSDAARALLAAMESTGVARVVALSRGVRDDDPHLAFWYRWRRSFARARSIGPSSAPPTSRTGRPPGPTGSRTAPPPEGGWKLARTDLARFITDELDRHRWSHAAPTIAH